MVRITLTEQMMYRIGFAFSCALINDIELFGVGKGYEFENTYKIGESDHRLVSVWCLMESPTTSVRITLLKDDEEDESGVIQNKLDLSKIIIECLNKVV